MGKRSHLFFIVSGILLWSFYSVPQKYKPKTINEIVCNVKSIYQLKYTPKFDSIDSGNFGDSLTWVNGYSNHSYRFVVVSKNVKKYYEYGNFYFYLYSNTAAASDMFKGLVNFSHQFREIDSVGWSYLTFFPKSGCTYFLYENIIIQHIRKCDFEEKIETPKENKFIAFLYENQYPQKKYLIWVLCGGTIGEIR